MMLRRRMGALAVGLALIAGACGSDGDSTTATTEPAAAVVDLSTYTWQLQGDGAPWGGRAGLRVVNLDDSVFLLGGRTPRDSPIPGDSDLWGDVWRSDDLGVSWAELAVTDSAFPARAYFQALTFDDEMWVLGGQNFAFPSSTFFNDVWHSADGVTWEQATAAAPWQGRAGLMAAALGDAMYVFGGSANDDAAVVGPTGPAREYFNDVWRSVDGVTWEEVSASAPWSPRAGGAVVVKDDTIYLLGGEEGFVCAEPGCVPPYFNDVWKTTDGETWEEVTSAAPWSPRPGHQCELLDETIVCFGGFGQEQNPMDMWRSEDGAEWAELRQTPWNATTPVEVRYDFDSVAVTAADGTPAILTAGGDRETFDFTDPENYLRVDDDVWIFANASG